MFSSVLTAVQGKCDASLDQGSLCPIIQALDPNNSPGWDTQLTGSQKTPSSSSKLPLFVKNVAAMIPQAVQGQETTQVLTRRDVKERAKQIITKPNYNLFGTCTATTLWNVNLTHI